VEKPRQAAGIVEIVWAGRGVVDDMGNRSMAMVGPASWGDHNMEMQPCGGPGDMDAGKRVR
jgi:hypothetical protein